MVEGGYVGILPRKALEEMGCGPRILHSNTGKVKPPSPRGLLYCHKQGGQIPPASIIRVQGAGIDEKEAIRTLSPGHGHLVRVKAVNEDDRRARPIKIQVLECPLAHGGNQICTAGNFLSKSAIGRGVGSHRVDNGVPEVGDPKHVAMSALYVCGKQVRPERAVRGNHDVKGIPFDPRTSSGTDERSAAPPVDELVYPLREAAGKRGVELMVFLTRQGAGLSGRVWSMALSASGGARLQGIESVATEVENDVGKGLANRMGNLNCSKPLHVLFKRRVLCVGLALKHPPLVALGIGKHGYLAAVLLCEVLGELGPSDRGDCLDGSDVLADNKYLLVFHAVPNHARLSSSGT